jgi:hypothetical protein
MKTNIFTWFNFCGTLILSVLLLTAAASQTPDQTTATMNPSILANEIAASLQNVQKSLASITGIDESIAKINKIESLTLNNSDVPFLSDRVNNRSLWKITYSPGMLMLPSATHGEADKYQRNFEILFDQASGQLISISTRSKPEVNDAHPWPNAAEAEQQLKSSKRAYTNFPAQNPKITFLAALDIIRDKAVVNPLQANEIRGTYVMFSSQLVKQEHPVWVITLRGLPPLDFAGDTGHVIPDWQKDFKTNIVDAITGELYETTTVPGPPR